MTPYTRLVCRFSYPSIQTTPGNDNYPGPCECYSAFADSLGRVWVSTTLPIYVFDPWDDIPVLSPFGASRDVAGGDRGEVYSWCERAAGEVWGGSYSAADHVTRFFPSRLGVDLTASGINTGWRPRGATSDGVVVYFSVGPKDPDGVGAYGGIVEIDAGGTPTVHAGILTRDIMALDFYSGKIYALASGEGIPGADTGAHFYQIDPTTMTVDWSVLLTGDRGLSMRRVSSSEYIVISHLTSTTSARLQLVDISSQTRAWSTAFDGSANRFVSIYGRARNSIVDFDNRLWAVSDDAIVEIDLDSRTLVDRCFLSKQATNTGTKRITNLIASDRFGLGLGLGNGFWAWDPR